MGEKSQQKKVEKKEKPAKHSDFSEEYVDRFVEVLLVGGLKLQGKLVEARRYWIKLVTVTGAFYVNKAHVVYVKPQ